MILTISSKAFLLFSEVLRHCYNNNETLEMLDKGIIDLSKKVNKGINNEDYLRRLSNFYRSGSSKDHSFGYFYFKIHFEIKKDHKKQLKLNNSNPLLALSQKYILKSSSDHVKTEMEFINFIENLEIYSGDKEQLNNLNDDKSTSIVEGILTKSLYGTAWYLYYHEYESKTPYSVISRLILYIKDLENITLFDRKKQNDFKGKGTLVNGINCSILIINLTRETHSPKNLELRIILTQGPENDSLFLGQYMDFETGDEIISGTFVLENVKGHQDVKSKLTIGNTYRHLRSNQREVLLKKDVGEERYIVTEKELVYSSNWQQFIPNSIAQYLANKWKNFTKTKPIVSNINDLTEFLETQNSKYYSDFKFNESIEYDIFLLTPVGNISKLEFSPWYKDIDKGFFKYSIFKKGKGTDQEKNLHDEGIFEANDLLQKIGLNRIYYRPRVFNLLFPESSGEETKTIIDSDLRAMKKSRYVIVVIPPVPYYTSAFIKVGWAMQMEKPVYVYHTSKGILPKLLLYNYKDIIKVSSEPIAIKNIPAHFKKNYSLESKYL